MSNSQFPNLQYPYKLKSVEIKNGISIAYADEGSGDVLLFIHGLASYIPAFIKNIDGLKSKFRCIAIDLPGYGKSSAGVYDCSAEFYSDIVYDFINALDLKNVTIVGHSMGGHIALYTAARYPESVSKIVLCASAGFEVFTPQEIEAIKNSNTIELFQGADEQKINYSFRANFFELTDDMQFMIRDRIDIINTPNFKDYCQVVINSFNAVVEHPAFYILEDVRQPVLMVCGRNDRFIPSYVHKDDTVEKLTSRVKDKLNVKGLHIIDNCGHFVQWEKHEIVNKLISEFAAAN